MSEHPVFFDPAGRRRTWLSRILAGLAVVAAVVSTLFALSLLAIPLREPGSKRAHEWLPRVPNAETRRSEFLASRAHRALDSEIARTRLQPAPLTAKDRIVAAYYATWQEAGLASLRANAGSLTHLIPEWLHLNRTGDGLDLRDWDPSLTPRNLEVVEIARSHGIHIVPILSNAEDGVFDAERAARLLGRPERYAPFAKQVADFLTQHRFQGIHLDFESLTPGSYAKLPDFLAALKREFGPRGLELSIALEAEEGRSVFAKAGQLCDFVAVMAYDEHSEDGGPGPIASFDWSESVLAEALKTIPRDKLVLGIGSYAYDWPLRGGPAEAITFQDALGTAAGYRDEEPASEVVRFDRASRNTTFRYADDNGNPHEVWMLDGLSVANQVALARKANVRGMALWALGSEDPSLWTVFRREGLERTPDLSALAEIRYPYEVDFRGQGEILKVAGEPKVGARTLDLDPSRTFVEGSRLDRYASSYVIQRSGYSKRSIVLTFDDGPDPTYTPKILQTLEELGVPATFFVIGRNAERSPQLVRRMVDEGHEVGSHTFTHPNLGTVSDARAELELNSTQRAIQSITGRSTILFRPPYNADAEPTTADEVRPVEIASRLGYLTVGEVIDPQDWNLYRLDAEGNRVRRTGAEMAASVEEQLKTMDGTVVLFHDGGGDRSATIEALRILVPKLRAEGYRFVNTAELAGLTRDQVMPPLKPGDLAVVGMDRLVFGSIFTAEWLLSLAFLGAIGLGLARIGFILPLAWRNRRRAAPLVDAANLPTVSALIAAYNEEKVIVRTIQSVLASDMPLHEVIVVDDGSKDGTSDAVREAFPNDARVRLVRQENGGKAAALNHATSLATGEVLFCVDADTQLAPDAVRLLVRHFADPQVGAVAGNVQVGNVHNLLTRWQSIEYTTSQNLDRRAYAELNAITVVPGAIGAWRREAVEKAGGYSRDTLAEDMDLTWRIRAGGWKLVTESGAMAYTEAPDTFGAFFKQRFRWAYGTLQCLWKHRRYLGRYGWFGCLALPALWVFQIVFQALAPWVDLNVLLSVVAAVSAAAAHKSVEMQTAADVWRSLAQVAFLYGVFFVVELIAGLVAYRWERKSPRDLWWLFLQRFVYRQIMYGVVLKSIAKAIGGNRQGWGKLERKDSVRLPRT